MASAPVAGWYADPADPKNVRFWDGTAWTNSTRLADAAPAAPTAPTAPTAASVHPMSGSRAGSLDFPETTTKGRSKGTVIAIAAGVGLLAASITVGILAMSKDEPVATPTNDSTPASDQPADAAPNDTGETHELILPDGWVEFTSRSGAIEYQRDALWQDIYTLEADQVFTTAVGDAPGVAAELAGMWILDETDISAPTVAVVAITEGTTAANLRLQTMSFVRSNAASGGSGEYTTTVDEGYFTAQGYEAWRVDYIMDLYGTPTTNTAIGLMFDETIVVVYGLSIDADDSWIDMVVTLADTLVIVKAPTSVSAS